jgi:hypothetical protein
MVVPSRRVPSRRVPSTRRVPSRRVPSKRVPSRRVWVLEAGQRRINLASGLDSIHSRCGLVEPLRELVFLGLSVPHDQVSSGLAPYLAKVRSGFSPYLQAD